MHILRAFAVSIAVLWWLPAAQAQELSFDEQMTQVERQFPLVARANRFLKDIVGFCSIDPKVFQQVFESCLATSDEIGGGSPQEWNKWCREVARSAACVPPVLTQTEPPPGRTPPAGVLDHPFAEIVATGEIAIMDPVRGEGADPEACTRPRPANLGCRFMCKPCITFVCENGEWQRESLDFPDEICEPRTPAGGTSATACPRGDTGFCPAECSICF